jgi:hypothetical protein
MIIDVLTKEDLEQFKEELLSEIKLILMSSEQSNEPLKESKYLKSNQVQRLLSISPGTLQNFRINGVIPYTKIGGIILYPKEGIEKLLEDNMRNNQK